MSPSKQPAAPIFPFSLQHSHDSVTTIPDIPQNHLSVGLSSLPSITSLLNPIFNNHKLPPHGLSVNTVRYVLSTLNSADTNNHPMNLGVGEREGRVYSEIVRSSPTCLPHGIGRSGDINAPQPKAAGTSIIFEMTRIMLLDSLKAMGHSPAFENVTILPCATGMTMLMSILALSLRSGSPDRRRKVLWCRIDQKSCLKAIITAGFDCVVVDTVVDGDQVKTDLNDLEAKLKANASSTLCVISCTSCFAPRVPDKVDDISELCKTHGVGHIINNAYGLQDQGVSKLINRARLKGRVDGVVSSLDKNFQVPVGAAAVYGDKEFVEEVGKIYPGRGSGQGVVDLWCTLLEMGRDGLDRVLKERLECRELFLEEYNKLAERHGERVLLTSPNGISYGMTLNTFSTSSVGMIGSMLFTRCLSGARVVSKGTTKKVGSHQFLGYGSSTNEYHSHYLTAAVGMGMKREEVEGFIKRLDKVLKEVRKKEKKRTKKEKQGNDGAATTSDGATTTVNGATTTEPSTVPAIPTSFTTSPNPPLPNQFSPTAYHQTLFKTITQSNLLPPSTPVGLFFNMSMFTSTLNRISSSFPPSTTHCLAMKANPLFPCLRIAKDQGWGIEVASIGELTAAVKLGFQGEKIVYDSPAKTREEIKYALKLGVALNADNLQELGRIDVILSTLSPPYSTTIGIRINPQIGGGRIRETGTVSRTSKFGVPMEAKDDIIEAFKKYPWLNSLHCHCGSQGCGVDLLLSGATLTVNFADEINEILGERRIRVLDLGGGMPVNYDSDVDGNDTVTPERYCIALKKRVPGLFENPPTYIIATEYGRYVSSKAGIVVSKVEYTKDVGGRGIATIHAGADMFLRTCYTSNWPHRVSAWDEGGKWKGNGEHEGEGKKWDVVGPLCFSGDIVAENVELPQSLKEGDYIAVHDAGAYTIAMFSSYNSRQKPVVFGVGEWEMEGGDLDIGIMVEGERVEDTLRGWGME